jgi:hypothetical protein
MKGLITLYYTEDIRPTARWGELFLYQTSQYIHSILVSDQSVYTLHPFAQRKEQTQSHRLQVQSE